MEEGQGQGGLASSRQYGNALLGVRHQEEYIREMTSKTDAFSLFSRWRNVDSRDVRRQVEVVPRTCGYNWEGTVGGS